MSCVCAVIERKIGYVVWICLLTELRSVSSPEIQLHLRFYKVAVKTSVFYKTWIKKYQRVIKYKKTLLSWHRSLEYVNTCVLCSFQAYIQCWFYHARFWIPVASWVDVVNCNGVCHLVFDRRARSCPRERRGKLMLARRETTLQKTEMPKQTRYNSRSSSLSYSSKLIFSLSNKGRSRLVLMKMNYCLSV